MKKILFTISFFICVLANAQNYAGYSSGNYSGVNAVFFNPASISDSRYKWDFNLLSVSSSVANNYATIKSADMLKLFSADTVSSLLQRDLSVANAKLVANIDLLGPSVLFNASANNSFAITTRVRSVVRINDISAKFLNLIENPNPGVVAATPINESFIGQSTYSWSEIGLSYSRVLIPTGIHFLKAGFTVKYLGGIGAGFLTANNLTGTISKKNVGDAYLQTGRGNINYAFSGITGFDVSNITNFSGSGWGGDIGLVYELRANIDKYKINYDELRKDKNKYTLRIGISLRDIGSIKFNNNAPVGGSYTLNTSLNKGDTMSLKRFQSISNFNDVNAAMNSAAPSIQKSGAVSDLVLQLPTSLAIDVDWHIGGGFYINGTSVMMSNSDTKDMRYPGLYNYFQITPRYENNGFGIYVPFSKNNITNMNMGLAFNLGPLYFGSGTIVSALMKGDTQQFDAYAGFRVGLMQKKNERKKVKKEESTD
jgi:hypothetical protein